MLLISIFFGSLAIVLAYKEEDIENSLANNKVELHANRNLQQDTNPKPVWEPLKIRYEFEEPELALGDSYVNRLMDIMKTFYEMHLLVRRLDQNIILRFKECLNIQVPTQLVNVSLPYHQIFLVSVITDVVNEYIFKCAPCAMLPDNSRPVVMLVTVNLYTLKQNLNQRDFEKNIRILLHEYIQGTALLRPLIMFYSEVQTGIKYPTKQLDYFDPSHDILTTPRITELVQSYFNCSTALGLKLNSKIDPFRYFFDDDIFHDELMSYESRVLISNFTFVLLQDTGFYRVGQYYPDVYLDGLNKSCDFYVLACNSKTQYLDKFCYDETRMNCDREGTAIAKCLFNYGNGNCAFHRSYLDCRDTKQKIDSTLMLFGEGSACLQGKMMLSDKPDTAQEIQNTCAKYTCSPDRKSIQFYVGLGNRSDDSLVCNGTSPYIGGIHGYRGSLSCPTDFEAFCSRQAFCENSCHFNGVCMNNRVYQNVVYFQCYCRSNYYGQSCQYVCLGVVYKNQCLNRCPVGTFLHYNNICLDCPHGCTKCSNYVGNCTDCSHSNATIIDGFCDYKMRFVDGAFITIGTILMLMIQ